jgi:beta-aspartyl-peptidase (threonine type)
MGRPRPGIGTVLVHGGVSGGRRRGPPSLSHALPAALDSGRALDAVEAAVRALEDDPALNAGFGSVLNLDGDLELDAGIVDGSTGRCGAVANVRVAHPVSLARRVLEETPHVLMTGPGAMAFAGAMPVLAETTPEQRARWRRARARGELGAGHYGRADEVDTVGAVALDYNGDLAAGSSTGGVFGKMPGRVGDSPILGAGFFASERVAVVGTGVGELFLETLACRRVGALVEDGLDPQAACEAVIDLLGRRSALAGGVLALDRAGRAGAAFRGGSWVVEGPAGGLRPARLS